MVRIPCLVLIYVQCQAPRLLAPIQAPWKPEFGWALISSRTLLSNIGPIFGAGYSLVLLAFAILEYVSGDVLHPSAVTLKEIYWFGAA